MSVERLDNKVLGKVFDKPTLFNIHKLFNKGIFREFGSPVADGKEARVFTAGNDEPLAVKVYKVEAATFKTIHRYITGDPRFWHIGKKRRTLVNAWVKKEFGNLKRLQDAGVSVPRPYAFQGNVLVMQFIGDSVPAPQIRDEPPKEPGKMFQAVVDDISKAYHLAKVVHADMSEYNILMWKGKHYIIDVGQGVDVQHPKAGEWLERDVRNVCSFFSQWVKAEPEETLEYIYSQGGGN
jgi:RIO kinase 1